MKACASFFIILTHALVVLSANNSVKNNFPEITTVLRRRECICSNDCKIVNDTHFSINKFVHPFLLNEVAFDKDNKRKLVSRELMNVNFTDAFFKVISNFPCVSIRTPFGMVDQRANRSKKTVWLYGFLSTSAINIVSLSGGLFKPLMCKSYFTWILMWMIAVGVGSMCSVSVLQLIPESLDIDIKESNYIHRVCVIMASLFVFYLTDRLLKLLRFKNKGTSSDVNKTQSSLVLQPGEQSPNALSSRNSDNVILEDAVRIEPNGKILNAGFKEVTFIKDVPPVVWMVLIGDGLHNFVDGLTIGAAFVDNTAGGLSIFLAILCEEIPCELGDFAVFIKSGLPLKAALGLNFLCASTNYLGLIVSILMSETAHIQIWVYCIAGGMFLYISLGVMFGEMADVEEKILYDRGLSHATNAKSIAKVMVKIILVQNFGLILGFAIQFLVLVFMQ